MYVIGIYHLTLESHISIFILIWAKGLNSLVQKNNSSIVLPSNILSQKAHFFIIKSRYKIYIVILTRSGLI